MFGTPSVVKSDNGPPFNSEEFKRFADQLGFHHRKVTPLWPQANGEVERFIKTAKKVVKTASVEGENWRKSMQRFLRSYRTTPHTTTGVSPATLFLGRPVRNKLPSCSYVDPTREAVNERDSTQKMKMKAYADRKSYVKPSDIAVGDTVLVKRPFNMVKGATPFEPLPLLVTDRKGTMISAESAEHSVTRNSSHFKRIPPVPVSEPVVESRDPIPFDDETEIVPSSDTSETNVPREPPEPPVETPQRPRRKCHKPAWQRDYVLK